MGGNHIWKLAADGVLRSVDVDRNGRLLPTSPHSPHKPTGAALPVVPPFRRQATPFTPPLAHVAPPNLVVVATPSDPPSDPPRLPLVSISANVLANEIALLERENRALRRRVYVQDKLIVGFCGLKMEEK